MSRLLSMLPLAAALSLLPLACGPKGHGDDSAATDSGGDDTGSPAITPDADGDTISDADEGTADTDGDGTADNLDLDSDGDGIPDAVEAGDADVDTPPIDSDGDGSPDFVDLDSDGDCITDSAEAGADPSAPADTDSDGAPDYADADSDGDTLPDAVEVGESCEAPVDSDLDAQPDYLDPDSDNDGIGDVFEVADGAALDTDGDGVPDYLDQDSDGDGMADNLESGTAGDPAVAPVDTDGDGTPDFQDTDSDGDGLSDFDEKYIYLTDPYLWDTDGDGYGDGLELAAGSDPRNEAAVPTGTVVELGLDESTSVSFDLTLAVQQLDVALVADTTAGNDYTLVGLSSKFGFIAAALRAEVPDTNFGFATHEDYATGSMGILGMDRPFVLRQQLTSSTSQMQAAIDLAALNGGGDAQEASMEALYQALTGAGYDMNCDGTYDPQTDVLPFVSSSTDPFGGSAGQTREASTPGGGSGGGMGFRTYSLPVVFELTDASPRDPDLGDPSPGGCPLDAGSSAVLGAASDRGAILVGIVLANSSAQAQLEDLGLSTALWTGSSSDLANDITGAVDTALTHLAFTQVTPVLTGDDPGFVLSISPDRYTDVTGVGRGTTASFTLQLQGVLEAGSGDQFTPLTLQVIGDDQVLLGTQELIIVVPGRGRTE